jgi:hypothetical protein
MNRFDQYHQQLQQLRNLLPRLTDLLCMQKAVEGEPWQHLDARLLPLLDPELPLMVAICGGANSGKSTLFNSLLRVRLSPVRGDAGSTRRVLAAGHPDLFARASLIGSLFAPFGTLPETFDDPAALLDTGPPVYAAHPKVPQSLVLMDTPDFDTGSEDRYINRDIAAEVLEACNVLIYIVTNATYNNLENTRFMRRVLTEAGLRKCILVYNCSRTFTDEQVRAHLNTTAANVYGSDAERYLIGYYRTDTSDAVAAGQAWMALRPVRSEPDILDLLSGLDPRRIRDNQIQTTLAAFIDHGGRVVAAGRTLSAELDLYAGILRLALSRAVQQALVSVPLEKILQRMHGIWLETSPPFLKALRGVGSLIGMPARVIFSLVKAAKGETAHGGLRQRRAVDSLEELRANLVGAAAELRDQILAEELIAATTVKDPNGARLIELLEEIRRRRELKESQLPFQQTAARSGTVTMHVAAPTCTAAIRKQLESRSWAASVEQILSKAPRIVNIQDESALERELTQLVKVFRQQMNFAQKTRESFFASLNILPATLGIAYILTTGDPVGGSGIYAKLHGMFGMHDLWALVSIPASAGLDETGRRNLSEMLAPVIGSWLDDRARIVRGVFDDVVAGDVIREVEQISSTAQSLLDEIETALNHIDGLQRKSPS